MQIKKKYKILYILTSVFISSTGVLFAQKSVTHQSQYWLRYFGKYNLSPHYTIDVEFEDRRFFKDDRQGNWVLPRVTLERELGAGWSAGIGFTYYTSLNPQDPTKPQQLTVPELRPDEFLSYKQKIENLTISHRFQLEQRWTRKSSGSELKSGYTFTQRFRYQLQLQYPLIKKLTAAGTLNAKAADEILLNMGHSIVYNTFDQNRAYLGLNYGITNSFQVELGYVSYFQEQKTGTQYYNRDIARLTVYQTLNFYKKH